MLKTHDWYESYETPFLFRGNIPKLFYSFRVGLKSTFYGTSKFLLALYFFEALLIIVEVNRSMRLAIKFTPYLIKISEKLSNECYHVILENFKSFHKWQQ